MPFTRRSVEPPRRALLQRVRYGSWNVLRRLASVPLIELLIPKKTGSPEHKSAGQASIAGEALAAISRSLDDLLIAQRAADPRYLLRHSTRTYSRHYEDAIVAEIFARIGEGGRTFVEIGLGRDGACNTRALLERGWAGIWIVADQTALKIAKRGMAAFLDCGQLRIVEASVTHFNGCRILKEHFPDVSIDFLSLGDDFNTSHAWRALDLPARVACVEYNASIPPQVEWEAPYAHNASWDGTNYFGASLKTLASIGRGKAMSLVGCDFHGVNAFFVADSELGEKFLAPFTAERHFEPPRYGAGPLRGHLPRSDGVIGVRSGPKTVRVPGLPPLQFHTHVEKTDSYITTVITEGGLWEPFETEVVLRLIRHFRTFIDLGANIGWYTLLARATMPHDSRIVAFEPEPGNFSLLKRNVAANPGIDAELVQCAVSDRAGVSEIYLSPFNQGDHRIYSSEAGRRTLQVSTVTLDDYFDQTPLPPLLLKCDTQGSEAKILRGGAKVLWPNLAESVLIMEFWPKGLVEAGESLAEVVSMLSAFPLTPFLNDRIMNSLQRTSWERILERAGTDYSPETDRYIDLVLLAEGSSAHEQIRDLIGETAW